MTPICVLVVDDERLLRWAVRECLERAGYRVLEAGTGKEALERLRQRVDLILLDIHLPDADGLELLEEVIRKSPQSKVFMMTSWSRTETGRGPAGRGIVRFLEKPFRLEDLVRFVEQAVGPGRPKPQRRSKSPELTD